MINVVRAPAMEVNMRRALLALTCVIAGSMALSLEPERANAGGYDYYDYGRYAAPRYYAPAPYYPAPAYYVVPVDPYYVRPAYRFVPPPVVYYAPPVYVPPPVYVRPASCGRYRYWTGDYCADARYRRPYLGPRW